MPEIKDARVKIVVRNTMNTCQVCGLPRSVCRAKLNFYPSPTKPLFSKGLGVTRAYRKGRVIVTP